MGSLEIFLRTHVVDTFCFFVVFALLAVRTTGVAGADAREDSTSPSRKVGKTNRVSHVRLPSHEIEVSDVVCVVVAIRFDRHGALCSAVGPATFMHSWYTSLRSMCHVY